MTHSYRDIILSQLTLGARSLGWNPNSTAAMPIEVGAMVAWTECGENAKVGRVLEWFDAAAVWSDDVICDRSGIARPVYRTMVLMSLCRVAGGLPAQTLRVLKKACALEIGVAPTQFDAEHALNFTWQAALQLTAHRWLGVPVNDNVKSFLVQLIHECPPDQAAWKKQPTGHPEVAWEMQLQWLEALKTIALYSGDSSTWRPIIFAYSSHLFDQAQPDHASLLPWGLAAFCWNRDCQMLADQLLHQTALLPASAMGLMLLSSSLYCVEQLHEQSLL